MLADIIIFLIVAGLIGGLLYVMARPNRYAFLGVESFVGKPARASYFPERSKPITNPEVPAAVLFKKSRRSRRAVLGT